MIGPDEQYNLTLESWAGGRQGCVYLELYRDVPMATGPKAVVVMRELDDNPGPSVTNAAEYYWPQALKLVGVRYDRALKLESYMPSSLNPHPTGFQPEATYDEVVLTHAKRPDRSCDVGWRTMPLQAAEDLRNAGIILTDYINHEREIGGRTIKVSLYDGRSYYYTNAQGLYERIGGTTPDRPKPVLREASSPNWIW